jgi:DNA-binding NarL/FixJ family response regulator
MRLVLADDSLLFREGLARLLGESEFEIVATVGDADSLLQSVAETRPDAAIVDIRMPPTHTDEGLAAAAEIRSHHPEVAVIVLSQYVEAAYALRLLEAGESRVGYVLKDRVLHVADFAVAIRRVVAGETVVDPALVEQLLGRARTADPLAELTAREREVLALMAEGLTDKGIAERLWVTPKTVETHIHHIFNKLSLPSNAADNRRVHAVLTYLRTPDGAKAPS